MKKELILILAFALQPLFAIFLSSSVIAQNPRLLITTDIGGDPDDQQAVIRLMLYTNDFDMEGLIASGTHTPEAPDDDALRPELIEEIVHGYGQVHPNLLKHDESYPTPEYLLSILKKGNPHRGDRVGEDKDTEASEWIIRMVDKKDKRPLNICIFGGQVELQQALWKVKRTRTEKDYQRFVSQIRVFDVGDQDRVFKQMFAEHPSLFYILSKQAEGQDKREGAYRGMYLGGDESLTSLAWLKENVLENHGPMGALYPTRTWTAPNLHGVVKEGDTPSWFFFVDNGLGCPEHPEYGSWGGRYQMTEAGYYRDATDSVGDKNIARATVYRWRGDYQSDFAARMDWCVKDYDEANHSPIASVNGSSVREALTIRKKPGEIIHLDASKSKDPDGDQLRYEWMVYPEAGSFDGTSMLKPDGANASLSMPELAEGTSLHIILKVTDNREPNITAYKRIILLKDEL